MLFITFMLFILFIIIYIICYFFTINHKNYNNRNVSLYYHLNSFITYILFILFILFIINTDIILKNNNIINLQNIIIFLLISDTYYYWYHYSIHHIPLLKKYIHFGHHVDNNLLLPLDLFHSNIIDNILIFILMYILPLFFIKLNLIEYVFIIILLFYHNFYIHSDTNNKCIIPFFIDAEYHKDHHKLSKVNYSGLFPNWDEYMNTRKVKISYINKKIKKIKNK
jgi:sterol desaturase/sphingolipid hydroxylase (fatty acid hydroxylase superfamily)